MLEAGDKLGQQTGRAIVLVARLDEKRQVGRHSAVGLRTRMSDMRIAVRREDFRKFMVEDGADRRIVVTLDPVP